MVFAFVGVPLAGKSTIIKGITKVIDIPVISTGELAREAGMKNEESIKDKDLSMNLNDMIVDKVLAFIESNNHCILDGFPRSKEQIELLSRYEHETIYIYANVLDVLERGMSRNRDVNDSYEVMLGRYKAANKLRSLLYQYDCVHKAICSDENFDDRMEEMIEYIKEKIK